MHPLQVFASAPAQGQPIWFLDGLTVIKVSADQSGGSLSVVEDLLPPGRSTPYHLHHKDDETFYLIEGECTFFSGTTRFQGGPGTVVFLPRGIPHGFRADTHVRMLIVTAPGGFDRFVVEAGEPAGSLTLPPPRTHDFAKLTAQAARYGIEILGPLPE